MSVTRRLNADVLLLACGAAAVEVEVSSPCAVIKARELLSAVYMGGNVQVVNVNDICPVCIIRWRISARMQRTTEGKTSSTNRIRRSRTAIGDRIKRVIQRGDCGCARQLRVRNGERIFMSCYVRLSYCVASDVSRTSVIAPAVSRVPVANLCCGYISSAYVKASVLMTATVTVELKLCATSACNGKY